MDQPESQEQPNFPVEVWNTIFEHLPVPDLLRARLVCQWWNEIITETSSLLNKLTLHVYDYDRFPQFISTSKIQFTSAMFRAFKCMDESYWFESFGDSLKSLTISSGIMSTATLPKILKATPNLTFLKIRTNVMYTSNPYYDGDFELRSLQTLQIAGWELIDFLSAFSCTCPNLKNFAYRPKSEDWNQTEKIVDFIRAKRNTLVELKVLVEEHGFWTMVSNIEGLHLTRIEGFIRQNEIVDLCIKQPDLKILHLHAPIPDKVLHGIGEKLTQLQSLSLEIGTTDFSDSFLNTMPGLNHLSLTNFQSSISNLNFGKLRHQNINHLDIERIDEPCTLLSNFPNIRTVRLGTCTNSNWTKLINSLALLKHLENLIIIVSVEDSNIESQLQILPALQSLTIFGNNISQRVLITLITTCCPELRELHLIDMRTLEDADVRTICQALRHRLKKIRLTWCKNITEEAVNQIFACCPAIEKITLDSCLQMTRDVIEKMDVKKRGVIEFKPSRK